MNKIEVKTPVLVVIAACVVGVVAYFGMKTVGSAGNLDHGQISYTPGVPPWDEKDPAKRAQFSTMPGELRDGSQAAHGPSGPK